jgi:hypothetical protein
MLGQRDPPGVTEIKNRAKGCARIFLHGCAIRSERREQASAERSSPALDDGENHVNNPASVCK